MTTAAIHLYDTLIGAITWDPEREQGFFEYEPSFLGSGIEIAPLTMPLAQSRYTFPSSRAKPSKASPACSPIPFRTNSATY